MSKKNRNIKFVSRFQVKHQTRSLATANKIVKILNSEYCLKTIISELG